MYTHKMCIRILDFDYYNNKTKNIFKKWSLVIDKRVINFI